MIAWRRLAFGGLAAVTLTALAGGAIELWRFGRTDAAANARVERDVRRQFDRVAGSIQALARGLAAEPAVADALAREPVAAAQLFDLIAAAAGRHDAAAASVTIYGGGGAERAWIGRPSAIPAERLNGPAALFVAPGPLGLRLVYVQPVSGAGGARVGTVAAERVLSPTRGVRNPAGEALVLRTSLAAVALRPRYEGAGDVGDPRSFLLQSPSGEPLLQAQVRPGQLASARTLWRTRTRASVLIVFAIVLALLTGPLLDHRLVAGRPRAFFVAAGGVAGLVLASRAILWWVAPALGALSPTMRPAPGWSGLLLRSPADLLISALAASALVSLAADALARSAPVARRIRRDPRDARLTFVATQLAAGAAMALVLLAHAALMRAIVDRTSVDLLHLSLHPWRPARLALLFAVVIWHATALWAAVLLLRLGTLPWRVSRRRAAAIARLVVLWVAPAGALAAFWHARPWPWAWILIAASVAALIGSIAPRLEVWYGRAPQPSRLLAGFLALVLPATLTYPSLAFFGERAKQRLVESQYAVQSRPQELQARLARALEQIDAVPALNEIVKALAIAPRGAVPTESAFAVWRQSDLAAFRLRSSVELYGAGGALVSRFALNLPEYNPSDQKWESSRCEWTTHGEATLFGSEERNMLHADRRLCETDADGRSRVVGSIVVHVLVDYGTLPFISSQSPYSEVFRSDQPAASEGVRGRDIEFVVYGWGRLPVYVSGDGAWPLADDVFRRVYASRQPFWTSLARGRTRYHVYFSNDRGGIYALGYPALAAFDRLVHLAEIATLCGVAYVVGLFALAFYSHIARQRPLSGRALLRQIRASFYRKLFLAFVAAAVIPVITLAFVSREYFERQLLAAIESEAARIVEVARRVIALQLGRAESLASLNDNAMLLTSQVIDQDVNLFIDAELVATSERDLFASGLLPTRTPDGVYRAIALQRLPSFVGEDAIGGFDYLLAAAPVNAGGRSAILTVPLASRQQEIEQQIDDIDRGVHLATVLFILVGAGLGFYMAERIADPIKRLTRATRRIARGDFDARVAVRSIDELRRLVEAFNSMAAELKAQRGQLERTHRLEAWADMARQVAHEIKNPLTPIQLSAEHLRRVHADRGEPLSPVLEGCVDSILTQVRLLRQIAGEFSSFASSPTPRPEPTDLGELVREVLEPYRSGLADRIRIDVAIDSGLVPALVDRTLVGRALVNVIDNALHAMPGAGTLTAVVRRVTGRGDGDDDEVQIAITDTGVGMEADALARIFEPYFSTKATGSGLGLTIAKRNVEMNGGAIRVESQKGRGTRVTLGWKL